MEVSNMRPAWGLSEMISLANQFETVWQICKHSPHLFHKPPPPPALSLCEIREEMNQLKYTPLEEIDRVSAEFSTCSKSRKTIGGRHSYWTRKLISSFYIKTFWWHSMSSPTSIFYFNRSMLIFEQGSSPANSHPLRTGNINSPS